MSPLPDYIRFSRNTPSEKLKEIIFVLLPIRLGKRQVPVSTNPRSQKGLDGHLLPFLNRGKRSLTDQHLSEQPREGSQINNLNPNLWENIIRDIYNDYYTTLGEELVNNDYTNGHTDDQMINNEVGIVISHCS